MTNLDSVLKSRDITLMTKICTVKALPSGHVQLCELDSQESREELKSLLVRVKEESERAGLKLNN